MPEDIRDAVVAPKKKSARCGKTCTYFSNVKEPQRCKAKCGREPGHILNCKCRSHDLQ